MPGTKLSEQKIGDIFNVSRTVVRQAFNQLNRDRLLVLEPARGAFVAMPTVDEAKHVFEVRNILETAVTRQLCAVITNAQIKELRYHLQLEREAVANAEVSGRTRLLADFHLVLAGGHGTVASRRTSARPCAEERIRRWLSSDADVPPPSPQRLALDVEARLPTADQFQFPQQCGKFAGRRFPD